MNTDLFDAIIVGAGQAGPAIAACCSREGLKTAVIERHPFGGPCVNVGCVPTETLVASARAVQLARRGSEFGFDVADLLVDMARVMARKDTIVATSRKGLEAWMRGLKGTDVIVGNVRFVSPATLEVGGRRLGAPRIFLNVGDCSGRGAHGYVRERPRDRGGEPVRRRPAPHRRPHPCHALCDIMAADQPYTVISRAVHVHPTMTELVPTLLLQLKPV